MAYAIRELTLYEVFDEESGHRYTVVEDENEAEAQRQQAQDRADALAQQMRDGASSAPEG